MPRPPDAPPPANRRGSYTTARVTDGRVERVERHVARLRRDAERLGLEPPGARAVEETLLSAAREAFGTDSGIVRIEWSAAPGKPPELAVSTRELGPEARRWRARTSQVVHPGPEQRRNTKRVGVDAYDRAREEARRHGVDEMLLFDDDGRLVEGGHSNFLIVDAEGRLSTPDPALGAVEGLGLSIVREGRPDLRAVRIGRDALRDVRELMSVNCVRGVVPIVELDGTPLAGGEPGPWSRRLRTIFSREAID